MRTLRVLSQTLVILTLLTVSSPRTFIGVVQAEETVHRPSSSVSTKELEIGIADRLKRVEEFRFIEEEAAKLGVRAYLFGGTAAGYAHYVKWDLQREKGDKRFQKDRFDYDYTNIYRSTQDLDIVIDGNPEQANKLQQALQQKYPHLQGGKTAWEVRLLTQDMGDKQAILNNPDFMNQHTDSNSTGLIEITKPRPGAHVVRDVRDWNGREPYFLKDVRDGMLHYYFSPLHGTTKFYKEGRNPPIFSAIRFLTKAFQYELKIRPEDLAQIKKIIQEFDPKDTAKHDYVAKWIEKNGKKLIQNAVNIEYAKNTLDQLGLSVKLQSIKGNITETDSLAWWMNKEPLRNHPVGQGTGKTARELGLDVVAHETTHFLAYESITRAHTGDPNVLISRNNAPGESAVHGDGFYAKSGKTGARGTGFTIRFHLDPNARLGRDFDYVPEHDFVIIKNKAAIKVIPESLNIGPVEYFKMLAQGDKTTNLISEKGMLEKLKRRIEAKSRTLSGLETQEILKIILSQIEHSPKPETQLAIQEWFSLSIAKDHPEVIDALLKKKSTTSDEWLVESVLSQPVWKEQKGYRGWVETLVNHGTADGRLAEFILSKPEWSHRSDMIGKLVDRGKSDIYIVTYILSQPQFKNHPEWVERLIKRKSNLDEIAQWVLSQPSWKEHPELVEMLLQYSKPYSEEFAYYFAGNILNQPHWKDHPPWVEKLMESKDADWAIGLEVLTSPLWKDHPEWVKKYIEKGTINSILADNVLVSPIWKDHPELVERFIEKNPLGVEPASVLANPIWADHPKLIEKLIKTGNSAPFIDQAVLSMPHWKDHPELRRLAGGQAPTVANLKAAFARGETVHISPRTCVLQHLNVGLH